jgi:hypothetical protein
MDGHGVNRLGRGGSLSFHLVPLAGLSEDRVERIVLETTATALETAISYLPASSEWGERFAAAHAALLLELAG